jgi:Cd2+/Zn2+-exporting ATPase
MKSAHHTHHDHSHDHKHQNEATTSGCGCCSDEIITFDKPAQIISDSCCTPQAGGVSSSCCDHDHITDQLGSAPRSLFSELLNDFKLYIHPVITLSFLLIGFWMKEFSQVVWFSGWIELAFYATAFFPVGYSVMLQAWNRIRAGDVFTEFLLMSMASVGAFYIGEYAEGVAVMLFYTVGELFQGAAVRRARANIRSLLDLRPAQARVYRDGSYVLERPGNVKIGEVIQVLVGERVPLDGELISAKTVVDASALSGESRPVGKAMGEEVLSGMTIQDQVAEIRVTRDESHSALSRILELVQEAQTRKAQTELFIRRFARVYTPLVTVLAAMVIGLPWFWDSAYNFDEWLYRGLVFLVISCPCALVISIPLGYFGGIGAASRHGVLVKGGNYLDALLEVDTIVFDKTGTLTHGVFEVNRIWQDNSAPKDWLQRVMVIQRHSTHPIARAMVRHLEGLGIQGEREGVEVVEVSGNGVEGRFGDGTVVRVGRVEWVSDGAGSGAEGDDGTWSVAGVGIDGVLCGVFYLGDRVREGVARDLEALRRRGVSKLVVLSGDREPVVERVSREAGVDEWVGALLPGGKAEYVSDLRANSKGKVAFVGDGINDAPSIAMADVGIAMGGLGSDAAIETADVVLQTDRLGALSDALGVARQTRNVVWQNIGLALGVKALVMILGAFGIATLWEAVFADVGVALLAILNAVRIR